MEPTVASALLRLEMVMTADVRSSALGTRVMVSVFPVPLLGVD
jgi:hypothetical protein